MKAAVAIIVVLLVLAGAVVGLAMSGTIDIPGLTPAKPTPKKDEKAAAAKPEAKAKEASVTTETKKPEAKPKPPPGTINDPDAGAESLASLWNEMDSAKLANLLKDWKDADVARVFLKMDPDKVADVLAQLDSKRASKISSMVEKQASIVKVES